jgi:hypothetical protein
MLELAAQVNPLQQIGYNRCGCIYVIEQALASSGLIGLIGLNWVGPGVIELIGLDRV